MAFFTKRAAISPTSLAASTGRSRRQWVRYSPWTFYFFVAPWVLGFLILTAGPLIYALLLSFTNFDGLTSTWHWIGIRNYVRAFSDPLVWYSLERTLLYTIITVPLSITGGLGIALLLNQRIRAVGIFRTIFYIPSVLPIVATSLMFRLVFDRDSGLVNALIEHLGGHDVSWLLDPDAFSVLILLVLWGLGGGMVIFLAGLQGVPQELLEAASLDGANALQKFRAITLPILSPVLFFQIVVSMIYSLQTLVQPLLLVQGMSAAGGTSFASTSHVQHGNYLYMVHVFAQFFDFQNYGYGSALLWILFIIVLLITLLIFRSGSFWVYYEVDRE